MTADHWLLTLLWLCYFLVHSLLAGTFLKQQVQTRWPWLHPYYRLIFNTVAVLLVIPPVALMYLHPGPVLWQWQGTWWWISKGCALLAVAGFLWTLKYYDMGEFIGVRPWQHPRLETTADFVVSPLHRYVRHPWYTLVLLYLWTRDMSLSFLITTVAINAYFMVGSRLEENKLIQQLGQPYRDYQKRVPGLLPRPWRHL